MKITTCAARHPPRGRTGRMGFLAPAGGFQVALLLHSRTRSAPARRDPADEVRPGFEPAVSRTRAILPGL
jgi:hypothetical protein